VTAVVGKSMLTHPMLGIADYFGRIGINVAPKGSAKDWSPVGSETINPPIFEKQPMIGTFINLAPDVHDRMKSAALECGVPMSEFCRTAISAYLETLEEPCSL
jgi:hypothetical protein